MLCFSIITARKSVYYFPDFISPFPRFGFWNLCLSNYGICFLFMLQFPVFNYGQHIFTHLMNRFHESEWILRTYGYIRYSYKRLSFAQFKSFISDAILHRYVVDNFLTPYKKSNWLVSFFSIQSISICLGLSDSLPQLFINKFISAYYKSCIGYMFGASSNM